MEIFESLSPIIMFYIYFISTIIVAFTLRSIFKKDQTYYVIFLFTIVLFAVFSKEFISTIPYNVMDVPRIIGKLLGSIMGILVLQIWLRERKTKRRSLV